MIWLWGFGYGDSVMGIRLWEKLRFAGNHRLNREWLRLVAV